MEQAQQTNPAPKRTGWLIGGAVVAVVLIGYLASLLSLARE